MGKKKLNNNYIKAYAQLESRCQEKFGVTAGGVDEYVKRLESARFAPKREEVLGKLSAYQALSRRFDTEPNALRHIKEVQKDDIKWVKKFTGALKGKKDPISRYLKSARKYARGRKARRIFITILILAVIAGAAVAAAAFLL
ncbi:MAG: hypothetical protein IKA53_00510 [Clostridia bacterium]|nr:hypothetical protein [Clostridia bacterium]MBR2324504.1 hypothetical protein [Clostridia bacterium]